MECRICGFAGSSTEYSAEEMMYGYRDVHRYFQCTHCDCLQIVDIPSSMQKYYQESYYSYQRITKHSAVSRWLVRARNRYAAFGEGVAGQVLSAMFPTNQFRFLQPLRSRILFDSSILDVGSGSGARLCELRDMGFTKVQGIDPFIVSDICLGNDVSIKKQYIHDVTSQHDLVMFHHSFEHVPDPLRTLNSVHAALKSDGWCIIRIPVVSSFAWSHYGVNWVQLDAPRHFFLHSTKSMKLLASESGFEISDIVYDSSAFQFWGSEQYVQGIPLADERSYAVNRYRSVFSKKDIRSFARRAAELNAAKQGDQAIFYLRKCRPENN